MKYNSDESHPFDDVDEDLINDFKYWTIGVNGDIGRPDREDVQISKEELLSQIWLTHVIKKERHHNTDSAESEFYSVFMEALKRAGYKKIILDVEDLYAPIIAE